MCTLMQVDLPVPSAQVAGILILGQPVMPPGPPGPHLGSRALPSPGGLALAMLVSTGGPTLRGHFR